MIGHDRFKRASGTQNTTEFTKFNENIEYTVIMPGQYDDLRYQEVPDQCKNFVMISGLLAGLLALSTVIVSRSKIIKFELAFLNSHLIADLRTGYQNAGQRKEVLHR